MEERQLTMNQDTKDFLYADSANTESAYKGQMTFDQAIEKNVAWVSKEDPTLRIEPENLKKYEDKENGIVAYLVKDEETGDATIIYQDVNGDEVSPEQLDASNKLTENIIADNPDVHSFTTTGYDGGGAFAENSLTLDDVSGATGFSSPDIGHTMTEQQRQIANSKDSTFYGDVNDPIFMDGRYSKTSVGDVAYYSNSKDNADEAHRMSQDRIQDGVLAAKSSPENEQAIIDAHDDTIEDDGSQALDDALGGLGGGGLGGGGSAGGGGGLGGLESSDIAEADGTESGATGRTIKVDDPVEQASDILRNDTLSILEEIKDKNLEIDSSMNEYHKTGVDTVADNPIISLLLDRHAVELISYAVNLQADKHMDTAVIQNTDTLIDNKISTAEEIAQNIIVSKDEMLGVDANIAQGKFSEE